MNALQGSQRLCGGWASVGVGEGREGREVFRDYVPRYPQNNSIKKKKKMVRLGSFRHFLTTTQYFFAF